MIVEIVHCLSPVFFKRTTAIPIPFRMNIAAARLFISSQLSSTVRYFLISVTGSPCAISAPEAVGCSLRMHRRILSSIGRRLSCIYSATLSAHDGRNIELNNPICFDVNCEAICSQ